MIKEQAELCFLRTCPLGRSIIVMFYLYRYVPFETGDCSVVVSCTNKRNQPPAGELGTFMDVTWNCTYEEQISLCIDNTEDRFDISKINITAGKGNYLYRVIGNDCRGFNNLSYTIHWR